MAYVQRQRRATHRPPNAASMRGVQAALQVLYGDLPTLPSDEHAQAYRALQDAPYDKAQGDLALSLPKPEGA